MTLNRHRKAGKWGINQPQMDTASDTVVDMSPDAISTRLEMVSQLHELCRELGKAQPVTKPQPGDESDINVEPQSNT